LGSQFPAIISSVYGVREGKIVKDLNTGLPIAGATHIPVALGWFNLAD